MERLQKRGLWHAAAFAPVLALAAYAALCTNPHYDLNDDVILLRAFGGMVGGTADGFHYIVHIFLSGLLGGLTALCPAVPWFTVYQLALLALSALGVMYGAMGCARRLGAPVLGGWLAGCAYLAAFVAEPATSITYTSTVAVAGGASIWLLLAVDWTGGKRLWGVARAAAPLLLGYLLRSYAALPALCLWLGAALCIVLVSRISWKRVLPPLLAVALLFAALAGAQRLAETAPGNAAYVQWQQARTQAVDYGGLASAPEETVEEAGWSRALYELALEGCLMDEGVSQEALNAIGREPLSSPEECVTAIRTLFRRSRGAYWACVMLAGLCLAAFLLSAARRQNRLWSCLAPVGCVLAAGAMLLVLAMRGRLPARAAQTALLPAAALAGWLALRAADGLLVERGWLLRGRGTARALAAALACVALALPCARTAWKNTYNPPSARAEAACTRLERYALANAELLLITDGSFAVDRALFPDWSAGKPANLLLNWGGWNYHSEGYRAALAGFGYAHDHFRMENLLDGPVRLVTAQGAQPSAALLAVLTERMGRAVTAELADSQPGFDVYRFQ